MPILNLPDGTWACYRGKADLDAPTQAALIKLVQVARAHMERAAEAERECEMAGRGLNKVQIIGNLGKLPEMKYTQNGKAVTTFSVAVTRSVPRAEGQWEEQTEWFRVVAWDKLAEICNQYLDKGSKVYVEGRLQTRNWENREGQKQTTVEIVAGEVLMLDGQRPATTGRPAAPAPPADDDYELPF